MRYFLLIGALLLSISTYYFLISMTSETAKLDAKEEEEKVYSVVFAKNKISGSKIVPGDLKWVLVNEDSLAPGAIIQRTKSDDLFTKLYNKTVLYNTYVNQQFIRQNVTSVVGGYLSRQLEAGYRAYAIKVDAISAVGGFLIPGDIVDIVSTRRIDLDNDGFAEPVSTHILQDIKVIAVGDTPQNSNNVSDETPAGLSIFADAEQITIEANTVVVEVSPKDVEILASAATFGGLSLVLKRGEDKQDLSEANIELVELGTTESIMEKLNELRLEEQSIEIKRSQLVKYEKSLDALRNKIDEDTSKLAIARNNFSNEVNERNLSLLERESELEADTRTLETLKLKLEQKEIELLKEREQLTSEVETLNRDKDEFFDIVEEVEDSVQQETLTLRTLTLINGSQSQTVQIQDR